MHAHCDPIGPPSFHSWSSPAPLNFNEAARMYHIFIKVYLTVKYHLKLPPDFAWNNLYKVYCILPQRWVISDLATVISAWLLYQQPKPRTIYIKLLCTIYVHLRQFSKSETSWTRIYFENKTEIYIVRAAPETTQKNEFQCRTPTTARSNI